ncbi:MAG: hypothetical protein OXU36_14555 [Candidatus Poribacteria bacterium]|nr:hypothetical protein [Candidatus Poribacteria bacterium]
MANKPPVLSEEQWKMPVSITSDGRWISLREFAEKRRATLSSRNSAEQLAPRQQAKLVEKRLAYRPDFKVAMIGIGMVDQERAIQEIREQTPAGRTLINIELRTIKRLMECVQERDG